MYRAVSKEVDYSVSTSVVPDGFGGWMAVNVGTAACEVNGFPLQPGEGLDFTNLHPEVLWNSPIKIVISNVGGKIRMSQIKYNKIN